MNSNQLVDLAIKIAMIGLWVAFIYRIQQKLVYTENHYLNTWHLAELNNSRILNNIKYCFHREGTWETATIERSRWYFTVKCN